MQLNHLDLSVPDLASAADFFERGFGFKQVSSFGDEMRILVGEDRFVLALSRNQTAQYPPSFHIGFLQPSAAAVSQVHQRLLDAGIAVESAPARRGGAFLFHCRVPASVLVEVAYRPG